MFIYQVQINGNVQNLVSFLSTQETSKYGLPSEAVVGSIPPTAEEVTLNNFQVNPVFLDFLHTTITKYAPALSSFQAEARQRQDGWVYVIDRRTSTPQGQVPPEDILGAFQIHKGKLIPGSYKRNTNYQLLSKNGFFHLDSEIYQKMLDEIQKL